MLNENILFFQGNYIVMIQLNQMKAIEMIRRKVLWILVIFELK